ncbi:MAG: cytochrome c family protein [Planctomycetes bacterium]|nr:cytochrome c family protein [Planctomycetota bacterium]
MSWNAPQKVIFPRWVDPLVKVAGAAAILGGAYVSMLVAYGASPKTLDVGYAPEQPVPYSHALHVGQLGLDCRYCHTSVERGPHANVPPTATCMNCHTKVLTQSPQLEPVRESAQTGKPIPWVRVHDLPNYVYFDHSAHVTRGIGCVSCHGRVDTMDVVQQVATLSMAWCVDCHRHPERHLRPPEEATNMTWAPPGGSSVEAREAFGRQFRLDHKINPPTDCSTCHR